MNWDAIGAIGEVLGAAAVVLTLGYLAAQIRQNSQAVKNSAAQSLLSEVNGSLRVVASSTDTVRAVILGQLIFDELTVEERAQFFAWYLSWMRTIELAHFQYAQGYIDEEIWEGHEVHLRQLIQAPGIRLWWSERRDFFSQRFQNYIDELAALGSEMLTPAEVVRQMSGQQSE